MTLRVSTFTHPKLLCQKRQLMDQLMDTTTLPCSSIHTPTPNLTGVIRSRAYTKPSLPDLLSSLKQTRSSCILSLVSSCGYILCSHSPLDISQLHQHQHRSLYNIQKSLEVKARAKKELAYIPHSLVNILHDYKCLDLGKLNLELLLVLLTCSPPQHLTETHS